jgi:hypothetical protein
LCAIAVETDDKTGLATRVAAVRLGAHLEQSTPAFWTRSAASVRELAPESK